MTDAALPRAWELAQVNVARARTSVDSPELAEFVAALDPINAIADAAPGFVWRLQTEEGNATSLRVFDGALLVNMSVWESVEALADFAYSSEHVAVMRRRAEWFHRMAEAYLALWWVPAGHRPSLTEAEQRLTHLREHGPTEIAFTFRDAFPPPDGAEPPQAFDEQWMCPTG